MSGYTKEELLTMSIVDLNVNENKKEINLRIQNLFKAGKDRFETIHKRKDGSFRNVEINVTYFSYIEKLFVVFIHDITERKQAEQAIKKVKEQLESLTSAVPGVLYQFLVTPTGEWKFIYVSEGIKSLYEVTPDKAYNDHNVLTQCILQEDQISHRESVKSSFLNLSFWIHEHRIITPGGALKWVRGQAIPQRQEDGSVLWNGILIDITERKQIEQALKESEDKYRLLSEKTTDGISLVEHGKVKYVSDGYQKMLGYEKNEIEKITFEEIFSFLHPDDVKKILDQINLAHLQQENSFKYDYRARHKNSQYIWVEDMINAEYDDLGNHIRSVIHSRDISERKRMEQIKESRLHLLSDAAEKSLEELLQATLDELELLTESSIGFYHFLNADQETLILQTWSTRTIKEMCTAEGKGQHYNVSEAGVWGDCIRERRAIVYNDYATLLHHKGLPKGHAEIIRILVVPIFRGGSIVAILGVGNKPSDYTDHDIAIVSDLADLGWDIKEKLLAEQKLNKTMLELETLNNTKDKFFSIIAHDLRNPFAGIMGLSEIMETKLVESNKEPELLKYSQMIKTSSKHAFDLLDNLMHWARSQRGEISLNLQNIPMKYLLAITIPVVSGNAFKKSITLESQLSDEDIVYADDSLTSTILRNLLTNAIKFTNQNGKITISTNKKDEFLEISVTDTGVGIEAKNLDKIFRIDTKFSNVGRHEQRKRNWTWTYSL